MNHMPHDEMGIPEETSRSPRRLELERDFYRALLGEDTEGLRDVLFWIRAMKETPHDY